MSDIGLSDVVTLGQLADELNVRRSAVHNWSDRYLNFPKPVGMFGKARVYSRSAILEWRESGVRITPKQFTNTLWTQLSPESRQKVEALTRELAVAEGLLDPEGDET